MKNYNIGIVSAMLLNKIDGVLNESNDVNVKSFAELINLVKTSPLLQLEHKVLNNIETKHIDNDAMALRYIDNNIKLFEVYTINEIDAEREKMKSLIRENEMPQNNKTKLYSAIDVLITESLDDYDNVDVNSIHEATEFILKHLKESKDNSTETQYNKVISEEVLRIAINKFNEKYESMNEMDKHIFNQLIALGDNGKENLLETMKNDVLIKLNEMKTDNTQDNIEKAIQKINEMKYNEVSVFDDILSLHELKKELI